MPFLAALQGFALKYLLQIVLTFLALGVFAWFVSQQRAIGEQRAVAKIEKANDNATFKGKRAAARSADRGVRGTRDPSTRDD